jgi:hypothetical protein
MSDKKQYDFSDFDEPKKEYDFSDFEDKTPKTESLTIEEEAKALGLQKIPDAALPKFKSWSEQLDDVALAAADAPGNAADRWEDFKEGIPLSEGARKLGAAAAPGKYEDNVAKMEKESTKRAEDAPVGSIIAKGAGGMTGPATAGLGFVKRVLVDAGLSAADAATRANELKDAFSDAVKAGGLSAGLNVIGKAISGTGKVVGGLDEFAERRAVKSLDPILSQQERLADKGTVNKLGREMLDGDIVKFGSSTDEIADNLEGVLNRDGKRIGEIRAAAEAAGGEVDLSRLAKKGDAMVGFTQASNPAAQEVAERYAETASSLAKVPKRTLSQNQEEIADLSSRVNFKRPSDAIPVAQQEAFRKVRGDLVDLNTDQIRQVTPENVDEYKGLLDRFSLFKDGDEIAQKAVARGAKNSDLGLRGSVLASRAGKEGGVEGTLKSAAVAMLEKLAKERGNSALAVGADKAAKMLSATGAYALGGYAKVLTDAANKGSSNFMMTHTMLMKSDPKYKALIEQEEGSAP